MMEVAEDKQRKVEVGLWEGKVWRGERESDSLRIQEEDRATEGTRSVCTC